MANSKYEYVRLFEQPDTLLANTWIVVRIDGRGFSKLTTKYKFVKPNDRDALDLMNAAAEAVMKELPDLVLAYGNSDEYSFVFHKDCVLFERRASKLTTTITSTFTSYYVFLWSKYFPDKPLTPPLPSFDGRAVCYPSDVNLRDYMSWRQVDCHINNLYNTTFWTLVQQGGMNARDAEQRLSGTVSSDKNEILFKEFGINYNNEPECFKKGTVLYRDFFPSSSNEATSAAPQPQQSTEIAAPKPKRVSIQDPSWSVEKTIPFLEDQPVSPLAENPGPTFLSPASTPSPPPSFERMSRSALPNPLGSNPVSPRTSSMPPITLPLSPPSSVTSPMGSMYISTGPAKQHLPTLTPLPLSPPTLRPSTKPPLSLDPPNPTTRDNFSPTSPPMDFPTAFQIGGYRHVTAGASDRMPSHSASASMTVGELAKIQQPRLKQRSPSHPNLPSYFSAGSSTQAPVIPLRISSIPANSKPRKLSLQTQRSLSTLKRNKDPEEKENVFSPTQATGSTTPRRHSPPMRTNKALPSPPMSSQEEWATRERVRSNSQDNKSPNTSLPQRMSDNYKRDGYVWSHQSIQPQSDETTHPGIAELPATSVPRTRSHARLHSAPTSATLMSPHQAPDIQALESASKASSTPPFLTLAPFPQAIDADEIQPTPPLKDSPRSRAKLANSPTTLTSPRLSDSQAIQLPGNQTSAGPSSSPQQPQDATSQKGKQKAKVTDQGGWAAGTQGRPTQISRSQKDRERKKRSKAKVLCEHVDIIKDEFWEKRPWILSGKTG